MNTSILLLGAGFSRRFGSDKRLHKIDGQPVAAITIAKYQSVFEDVTVVIRPEDTELKTLLADLGCKSVQAQDAHLGMGHSLASGVRHIQCKRRWLIIGLLDMPFIKRASLTTMQETLIAEPKEWLVTRFSSPPGAEPAHPIAWHEKTHTELAACRGDQGARLLLQKYADRTLWLHIDDQGLYRDIDHPEDI
ncbi:MAG: nucleotidyltransferase family protein [Pseudomonadota bacterium]